MIGKQRVQIYRLTCKNLNWLAYIVTPCSRIRPVLWMHLSLRGSYQCYDWLFPGY